MKFEEAENIVVWLIGQFCTEYHSKKNVPEAVTLAVSSLIGTFDMIRWNCSINDN